MTDYLALLRGINVGGIRIAMSDLRAEFEALGFRDVSTVLATGNVLFSSDSSDIALLRSQIETALTHRFAYTAFVFVHPRASVRAVVDDYPFVDDRPDRHSYVVFVSDDEVRSELLDAARDLDPAVERVADGAGVVYWEVLKKMTLSSPFGKCLGKARYKSTTTNRNLRTLRTVVA